ncbi:MAG: TauD/TfdA family dioxygenase [Actinomycetota bacterium]
MAERTTVARLETTDDDLLVWLTGADQPLTLPWFWVRDHSRDPDSFDHHTSQRTVDTFRLTADPRPSSADLVDGDVHVSWPDGSPTSILPATLLASVGQAHLISAIAGPHRATLWRDPAEVTSARVPFTELGVGGSGDPGAGLAELLAGMSRFGFGVVADVPGNAEGTQQLADAIGYVRRTIFGDIWPLSSDLTDHADSAYGQSTLEPHTDGSYSHDGPGIQLFVCSERTGTGGESILVDGFAAAEALRAEDPEAFELLSTVAVPAHYREPGVDLRAARPTIRLEGDTVVQVTFNNYDRSPFLLEPDRMRQWYRAYRSFHRLIVDEDSWWIGRLEPGDGLVFDNWRCLHGRLAFTGRRSFFGCYLNHEDLESRQRTNAAAS